MPHVVLLGTCDSKLDELLYLRSKVLEYGASRVTLVDVGRKSIQHEAITVSQTELTSSYGPSNTKDVGTLDRGEVIKYMIACASNWVKQTYDGGLKDPAKAIHAIISAGGTGGTSLASGAMRDSLPIGFPKLIVSTAASGDTSHIVGESDITLMYSVVDIAGTNSLLRRVLSNAAGAIVGMGQAYEKDISSKSTGTKSESQRKRVGLTMFGVTTPCVDKVREYLEGNYEIECFVFHCTGHGGKAMERLVEAGELDAVLDLTTTEIADHLGGGVMSAGEHRLEAGLKAGIPYTISVGATDMVNFGPKQTVPEKYQDRKLFEHNPTVTLMRTSPEECRSIADFIVEKVKNFASNKEMVEVVLPMGGVSMIAGSGAPFHDTAADTAIFSALKTGLDGTGIRVVEDKRPINDEHLAEETAERLVQLMGLRK